MVIEKKPPRHDTIPLIGDLNAKIGSKLEGEDGIAGRQRVCTTQKERQRGKVVSLCCLNNLAITTTTLNYVPSQRHPPTDMDITKQHA